MTALHEVVFAVLVTAAALVFALIVAAFARAAGRRDLTRAELELARAELEAAKRGDAHLDPVSREQAAAEQLFWEGVRNANADWEEHA